MEQREEPREIALVYDGGLASTALGDCLRRYTGLPARALTLLDVPMYGFPSEYIWVVQLSSVRRLRALAKGWLSTVRDTCSALILLGENEDALPFLDGGGQCGGVPVVPESVSIHELVELVRREPALHRRDGCDGADGEAVPAQGRPPHDGSEGADGEGEAVSAAENNFCAIVLTTRQRQIVDLVARGFSNVDNAHMLGIEEATVKTHLGRAYERTHTANRTELIFRYCDYKSPAGDHA